MEPNTRQQPATMSHNKSADGGEYFYVVQPATHAASTKKVQPLPLTKMKALFLKMYMSTRKQKSCSYGDMPAIAYSQNAMKPVQNTVNDHKCTLVCD
jgi:hypothetical protein